MLTLASREGKKTSQVNVNGSINVNVNLNVNCPT